jgi:peptidyl-tRNA hydrolase, PTH1 family
LRRQRKRARRRRERLKPPKKPQRERVKSKGNTTLLVLGLGNPGREYAETRHNAGFLVLEELAARLTVRFKKPLFSPWRSARCLLNESEDPLELILVQPLTYMNVSGKILPRLFSRYRTDASCMLVIYDTLDLPPGQIRLRARGSSGGQKGMESIIRTAGSSEFRRIAVGIGRPDDRGDVVSWVLGSPGEDDKSAFEAGVRSAADAVLELTRLPLERVMNSYNVLR